MMRESAGGRQRGFVDVRFAVWITEVDNAVLNNGQTNEDPDDYFVDAAQGDFSLFEGSLLVDAGQDAGITEDIVGVARPSRNGFDIGAYELPDAP